jgi:hypothetical protein
MEPQVHITTVSLVALIFFWIGFAVCAITMRIQAWEDQETD